MDSEEKVSLNKESSKVELGKEGSKVELGKEGPKVSLGKEGTSDAPKVSLGKETPTVEQPAPPRPTPPPTRPTPPPTRPTPPPSRPTSTYTPPSSSYSSYSSSGSRSEPKSSGIGCGKIIIAILVILAIAITAFIIIKNIGYSADNLVISVNSKDNYSYDETTASYKFGFVIENKGPNQINGFSGEMVIKNHDGKVLGEINVDFSGYIEPKTSADCNADIKVPVGENAIEIWNSDISELEITFRITSISFGDGKFKEYKNGDAKVVHECTANGNADKIVTGDRLLDSIRDCIGNDVIIPDNYESANYNEVGDCRCYSYYDGKEYLSFYVFFIVPDERADTFLDDFIEKLEDNGYTLRYKEYSECEYIKGDIVLNFGDVLPSYVYDDYTAQNGRLQYYYFNFYAYNLNQ